ncbi:MAG: hypothetical protein Q9222_000032 [Ikaeria aurantiellina]
MPSFYHFEMPRPMPPTPPECFGTYADNAFSNMYHQGHCVDQTYPFTQYASRGLGSQPLVRASAYGFAPSMHASRDKEDDRQMRLRPNASGNHIRRAYNSSHRPSLPPIQVPDQASAIARKSPSRSAYQVAPAKEEKATGGVAAHLDYEMDHMADFVAEMAQGMYELYESRICLADIDIIRSVNPNTSAAPAFRKYVFQILSSTRLPSSTILLGLHYLLTRMCLLPPISRFPSGPAKIYHLLTTALLLGSKFLDDNTFQNRSWSEVSNIPVGELNTLEIEWLVAIGWDLHIDPNDSQGFAPWRKHWQQWEVNRSEVSLESLTLTSLDVNFPSRQAVTEARRSPLSLRSPACNDENVGNVASIDTQARQWYTARYIQWPRIPASIEYSPPSAPETAPTTPDWYGTTGDGGFGKYHQDVSGRAAQALSLAQYPSYQRPTYHMPYTPSYFRQPWNGPLSHTSCACCTPQAEQYMMPIGYNLQPVVG